MENKKKNKAIITIVLALCVALVILLFGTYAWWQTTKKQTNQNVVGSACLSIEFSNESGDIELEDMWPTTDTDGYKLEPYSFTITNGCDKPAYYTIDLESIEDANKVNGTNGYLAANHLKVSTDYDAARLFSAFDPVTSDSNTGYTIIETRKLKDVYIGANQSRTHYLRIWIDENTPLKNQDESSNTNRYFFGKIKVVASQDAQQFANTPNPDSCFTITNDGVLTSYDINTCGTDLVIPESVNGIAVKEIADYFMVDDSMGLTSLDLSQVYELEVIGEAAFKEYNNDDIALIIPDNVEIIKDDAFYDYFGVNTELILPDSIKEIGAYAFGFNGIYLKLPSYIETIGNNAFELYGDNCVNSTLVIPGSLEIISDFAFNQYGRSSHINEYVMNGCSLVLSEGIEEIGEEAFEFYVGPQLILPSTLTKVNGANFYFYDSTDVIIPSSVNYIGLGSFGGGFRNIPLLEKQKKVIIKRANADGMTIPWSKNSLPSYVIFDPNYGE